MKKLLRSASAFKTAAFKNGSSKVQLLRHCRPAFLSLLITWLLCGITLCSKAQSLSYSTPQLYPAGVTINTLAPTGGANIGNNNFVSPAGTVGSFNTPYGVAVDSTGNVYVVSSDGTGTLKEIPANGGAVTTLSTGFTSPQGVAVDAAGNIYVCDRGANTVYKVPPGGGAPVAFATGFSSPLGVAVDAGGNVYVTDSDNGNVVKIPAGTSNKINYITGLNTPTGITVDDLGNIYVADGGANAVYKVTPNGTRTSIGSGYNYPYGVTVDGTGNVYVASKGSGKIIQYISQGNLTGASTPLSFNFNINSLTGVAISTTGILYATDYNTTSLYKISPTGGYHISSQLPAGLLFDNTTGNITGTPAIPAPPKNYIITAFTNDGNTITATVNIGVTSNASLASLVLSQGTLSPVYAPGTTSYTATVGNSVTAVTVTPVTSDTSARVKVNGTSVLTGTASISLPLLAGNNTINAVVTTADSTKTYTIIVKRLVPAPTVSYSSPQTYSVGASIAQLVPVSANVDAPAYGSVATINTSLSKPYGIAFDAGGNIYVSYIDSGLVKRIPAAGGSAVIIASGLNQPCGLSVDNAGNVYVAEKGNNAVRKIPAGGGSITTIGTGFVQPDAVAVDGAGNVYVTCKSNGANGTINKILAADGSTILLSANVGMPNGIVLDSIGHFYVSDTYSNAIYTFNVDGSGQMAIIGQLNTTVGLAVDPAGNIYYAEQGTNNIKKVAIRTLAITTIGTDFSSPTDVKMEPNGEIGIIDGGNMAVKTITPVGGYYISSALTAGLNFDPATGTISGTPNTASAAKNYTITAYNAIGFASATVNISATADPVPAPVISYAGPQTYNTHTIISPLIPSSVNVAAPAYAGATTVYTDAAKPYGIAIDAAGNTYLSFPDAGTVKEIAFGSTTPVIIASGLGTPKGIAVDAAGDVFVAENTGNIVSEIVAGSGTSATIATGFNQPIGVALDQAGNIFVADQGNNVIKKILATDHSITTLSQTFTSSDLNGIAADATGDLYITEQNSSAVYEIPAGSATMNPLTFSLSTPSGIVVDPSGNVFVAVTGGKLIQELIPGSTALITITTGLDGPTGVAIDGTGKILVAENADSALKQITPLGGFYVNTVLPAGLSLSALSGTISGTPITPTTAKTYTLTAYNGSGSSSATVNIGVIATPAPQLSYNSPQAYPINTAIPTLLPISTGVAAAGYKNPSTIISSSLSRPYAVANDAAGNIYVASIFGTILKYPAGGGSPTTFATSPNVNLIGLAIDAAGNVYYTNNGGSISNFITELPIGGGPAITLGQGMAFGFGTIWGIAVDGKGNVYVADYNNNRVVMIPAGNGTPVVIGSGFVTPTSVAVDNNGNVYVADMGNHAVKMVPAGNGAPVTIASNILSPSIALNPNGDLFVASYGNLITEYPADGSASHTIGGSPNTGFYMNIDNAGNIYTVDLTNTLTQLKPTGGYFINSALPEGLSFDATTGAISGTPTIGTPAKNYFITAYNSGGGTTSTLSIRTTSSDASLTNLTISNGKLVPGFSPSVTSYNAFVDNSFSSVTFTATMPDPTTVVTINGTAMVSGTASASFPTNAGPVNVQVEVTSGDSTATKLYTILLNGVTPLVNYGNAEIYPVNEPIDVLPPVSTGVNTLGYNSPVIKNSSFTYPWGMVVDTLGNMYVADVNVGTFTKLSPNGSIIYTYPTIAHATDAAIDAAGNIYATAAGQILKIPAGSNTPVVILPNATATAITIDIYGNIYYVNASDYSLNKIPANGSPASIISTAIGLSYGLAVDASGNIYVADYGHSALEKIAPDGTFSTIASGFPQIRHVMVDPAGNLFITDSNIKEFIAGSSTYTVVANTNSAWGLCADRYGEIYYTNTNSPVSINEITPSGGYFLATPLPAGLSLNANYGTITGTPTVGTLAANYEITAYNNVGGTHTQVNIAVTSNDAKLSNLVISTGQLSPVFSPNTTSYNISAALGVTSATVTPYSPDPTAVIKVNGIITPSGTPSAAIDLSTLPTNISIVETSQDGSITNTYTVTVNSVKPGISYNSSNKFLVNTAITPLTPTATRIDALAYNQTLSVAASGFGNPFSVAADYLGNLYVADQSAQAFYKISAVDSSKTSIFSGSAIYPLAVATDALGNVYMSAVNGNVYELPVNGAVKTIASGINYPSDLSVDAAGNVYVTEYNTVTVKEIMAGSGTVVALDNSKFSNVTSMAVNAAGDVFVGDAITGTLYKIPADRSATVTISTGLIRLSGLAVDGGGNLFIMDYGLRMIPAGTNTQVILAGSAIGSKMAIGPTGNAYVNYPFGGLNQIQQYTPVGGVFINNTLPVGLSFNTTTGAVSGTPTVATLPTNYTATAYNSFGSVSAPFNIAVITNNAALSKLKLNTGTLSPIFSSTKLSYTATVVADTTSITITPTAIDPAATVTVNGTAVTSASPSVNIPLVTGNNTINTVVTASDGVSTKTYTLVVSKLASNIASLTNLTLSQGALNPAFSPAITAYSTVVANTVPSITLTPTISNIMTASIGGINVPSGTASAAQPLNSGITNITLLVTAEDGVTTKSYTLQVTRGAASTNSKLTGIGISSGTLTPAFNPGIKSYTVTVPYATSSIDLTPGGDITQAITINGAAYISGAATVPLLVGSNTITVLSRAQNGTTTSTYQIVITRLTLPAPTLSYTSPQTYTEYQPISPLAPTSSNISAPGFSSTPSVVSSGFANTQAVARDAAGNTYVAVSGASTITKIQAGTGVKTQIGSGFVDPRGVAIDAAGNVYVADYGASAVEEIPAGNGTPIALGSGGLQGPVSVAVDSLGYVFVADETLETLAVITGPYTVPLASGFTDLRSVTVDAAENIYISDAGSNTIQTFNLLALFSGAPSFSTFGSGYTAPNDLAVDASGNLFFTRLNSNYVNEIASGSSTPVVIGTSFSRPLGLAADNNGYIYVADNGHTSIKVINVNGGYTISPTLPAGLAINTTTGIISGTPVAGVLATDYIVTGYNATGKVSATVNITVPSLDADLTNLTVSSGTLSPIFSEGTQNYSVTVNNYVTSETITGVTKNTNASIIINGGTSYSSQNSIPQPLKVGSNTITVKGSFSVGSTGTPVTRNYVITVTRLPATNTAGYSGTHNLPINNPVTPILPGLVVAPPTTPINLTNPLSVGFHSLSAVAADGTGNVYVLDINGPNQVVFKAIPGNSTPVPLNFTGLTAANGLAVDGSGNLYVSQLSGIINELSTGGTLSTINGIFGQAAIAADAAGDLYLADAQNNAIKEIHAGTGAITTFASVNQPQNVAVDAAGNVYVADGITGQAIKLPAGGGNPIVIGSGFGNSLNIAVDVSGNVFVTDRNNLVVKMINTSGGMITVAQLSAVYDVVPDNMGNLFDVSLAAILYKLPPIGGYYLQKPLPAGLTFDSEFGVITGTPTVLSALKPYPVTAYDNSGAATALTTSIAVVQNIATLSSITLSPASSLVTTLSTPAETDYTASVAPGTASVTVTPVSTDINAVIKVNGTTVASGTASAPVTLGSNPTLITAIITAVDGTTKKYLLTVNKNGASIATATLQLSPSATLVKGLSTAAETDYTTSVAPGTASVTLTPTTTDPNATITVNGITVANGTASTPIILSSNPTLITTVITAQDGVTTKTYVVTVNENGANIATASLQLSPSASLIESSGTAAETNYTTSVVAGTASVTLTPTVTNPYATITVNGIPIVSGTASGAITLGSNPTLITTVVTAADGTVKTYNITVNKNGSNIATATFKLSPVAVLVSTLSSAAETDYAASVAPGTASVTLTPTTTDPNATITVNGLTVASGTVSGAITLGSNPTLITAIVTAVDGTTKKYLFTINKNGASIATANFKLNPSAVLMPTLSTAAETDYTASVAPGTANVTLTPTATDPNATIKVNGITVASGLASRTIALASSGTTTITTVVTAQDGVTTKVYLVTISKTGSSIATASLKLNPSATLMENLGTVAENDYTASVAPGTASVTLTPTTTDPNATIKVNGITVASGSASRAITLGSGTTSITTIVTAQDGITTKTYVVAISKTGASIATASIKLSPSATLTESSGTAAETDYTTSVAPGTASVTLTPTTTDPNATIKVNGVTVANGQASTPIILSSNPTLVTTVITAQDGITTKTYSVAINKNGKSIATANFQLSPSAVLVPTLSTAAETDYTASVAPGTASVTLTPTATDPNATIKVNGITVASGSASRAIALGSGTTTITTVVTAQDGVTTKTYVVVISKNGASIATASLKLNPSATLMETLGTVAENDYTTSVAPSTASVTLTPTATDPNATIKVNGVTVASGSASRAITLGSGTTTITTIVTAQDGITTKTYAIAIRKTGASIATASLQLNPSATLVSTLSTAAETDYTASVAPGTASITLTPTATDPNATIKVNSVTVASGSASRTIALGSGTTTITTVVTAQDGITTKTYAVAISKTGSSIATASLELSPSATLIKSLGTAAETDYTTSVAPGTASVTLTPTATDPNATIKVNGVTVASGSASRAITLGSGTTTITTIVTAQDGVTTKTYVVAISKNGSSIATATFKLSPYTALIESLGTAAETDYTATVAVGTGSITLTPTATDPNAAIKVNGVTVASGTASRAITLGSGTTTVTTIVTAQNGIIKTYVIVISKSTVAPDNGMYTPALASIAPAADDQVLVHQAVSPNGDGVNDYLKIDGIEAYPDNRLVIMNATGNMVFTTSGYDNITRVFDGHSSKGAMQLAGTYFYELQYKVNGKTKSKTGFIILKY